MAKERPTRSNGNAETSAGEEAQRNIVGVMAGAQDAAGRLRASAGKAAEHLPEAMAGAEVAARETQKVLDEMPNQALIVGTSFSVGLGVGLFLTGSNRLLVLAAIAPAIAMAATLISREERAPSSPALG